MGIIRVQLFDFDESTGENKPPLTVEVEYDPALTIEEQGNKKVSIFAGDDVGGGTVLVPLEMLNAAMAAIVNADNARSSRIIMPDIPKLIVP